MVASEARQIVIAKKEHFIDISSFKLVKDQYSFPFKI
ncbi:hypothetical protein SEEJ0721_20873 [Salmonella enterica subsp. enterica serovar Javiana str. 10721]|nr:hypothetical protein SEEJ0721_20873 [Salmonella enterica subsp. enterica serovar Javiana str. 10721]